MNSPPSAGRLRLEQAAAEVADAAAKYRRPQAPRLPHKAASGLSVRERRAAQQRAYARLAAAHAGEYRAYYVAELSAARAGGEVAG